MIWMARASIIAIAIAQASRGLAQNAPDEAAVVDPQQDSTSAAEAAASPSGDTEIIVTAQRRAESVQDVPISITALGSESLERLNVTDLSDLSGTVAGLNVTTSAGQNSTNLVSLRGIAGQPLTIGASQATAVYLDGVYLTKPDAAFFSLDDVERIEVLRGPQGTLYGRNATAGAINIITRTPGEILKARVSASYGNFDSYAVRGSVSLPVGGGFGVGVSAAADGHDGYYTNTLTDNRFGEKASRTGRVKLHYDNNSGFDATLTGDMTSTKSQDVWRDLYAGGVFVGIGDPDLATTNIEDEVKTTVKTGGLAFTANLEVTPELVLTTISSWRTFDFRTIYDLDGTAATIAHTHATNNSKTFNQEIRGVYTGGALRATVGVNYYRDSADYRLRSNPADFSLQTLRNDSRPHDTSKLNAYAAFGHFEFDFSETLTAIGGLRYNYEKRDFTIDYSKQGPFPPVIGEIKDSAWLPQIGLNYEPTQDILVYAKASKGYQAPGFNFLPGAGNQINVFGAESLWAYEGGIRSQFLNRAVTFNAAAFYYDYTDVQVRSVISQLITRVLNAASAKVEGVEAELTVKPLRGLTLNGHVTYSRAVYTEFCDGIAATSPQGDDPLCEPGRADRAGNFLNQAPLWSGGIGAAYTMAVLRSANLNLNANYSWESNSYFTSVNEGPLSTGGWHRLDARVGLDFDNGLEIFAFGRNLTDDRYVGYAIRIAPTRALASLNDPRTYGLGARFRF